MVTTSRGKSDYHGLTVGVRKRLSHRYQLEANYVLARDKDDDSNERDPFYDRGFNFFDLGLDYASQVRHPPQGERVRLFQRATRRREARRAHQVARRSRHAVASFTERDRRGATPCGRTTSISASTGVWRGRSASARQRKSSRPSRCSTPSTTRTTSTRCRRRRCSTSTASCKTGVGDPRRVQLAVKLTF